MRRRRVTPGLQEGTERHHGAVMEGVKKAARPSSVALTKGGWSQEDKGGVRRALCPRRLHDDRVETWMHLSPRLFRTFHRYKVPALQIDSA